MTTLTIQYSCTKKEKITGIASSLFSFGVSIYFMVTEALISNYSILFFIGTAGLLISLVTFLTFTAWQPSPLLVITNYDITSNLPKSKGKVISWDKVKEVALGSGYIKLSSNDIITLDLSPLTFGDLNATKSKIVEICDSKSIPFHND